MRGCSCHVDVDVSILVRKWHVIIHLTFQYAFQKKEKPLNGEIGFLVSSPGKVDAVGVSVTCSCELWLLWTAC